MRSGGGPQLTLALSCLVATSLVVGCVATPGGAPAASTPTAGVGSASSPTADPTDAPRPGKTADPGATSLPGRSPLTPGIPRLAVWLTGDLAGGGQNELAFFGADGSGPMDMAPLGADGGCPSVDGGAVAYWADDTGRGFTYLYVAKVGARERTLVDELAKTVACPFIPESVIAVRSGSATASTLIRRPSDGPVAELVTDVTPNALFAASPDGTRVAVATGADGRALTIVDATGGTVRLIGEPFEARLLGGSWSPDGTRLVVSTGPWDPGVPEAVAARLLWVVDPSDGTRRRVAEVRARPVCPEWSPDGRSILILAHNGADYAMTHTGDAWIIDVATGTKQLVSDAAIFAGWSPVDASAFAYATITELTVLRNGAPVSRLAGPTGKLCPVCSDRPTPRWPMFGAGWSPDGRYIATGDPIVGVIDLQTQGYRVIVTDTDGGVVMSSRWWP